MNVSSALCVVFQSARLLVDLLQRIARYVDLRSRILKSCAWVVSLNKETVTVAVPGIESSCSVSACHACASSAGQSVTVVTVTACLFKLEKTKKTLP